MLVDFYIQNLSLSLHKNSIFWIKQILTIYSFWILRMFRNHFLTIIKIYKSHHYAATVSCIMVWYTIPWKIIFWYIIQIKPDNLWSEQNVSSVLSSFGLRLGN